MIKHEMYCEFCGKKIYSEYVEGGYIDHYSNFSAPAKHKYIGKNANNAVYAITINNKENYRAIHDIKERLNCFLQWNDVSGEVKAETKKIVDSLIDEIEKAQEKAKEIVSGMTRIERMFLAEEAKRNDFGAEDNKRSFNRTKEQVYKEFVKEIMECFKQ